ncbi:MAG TPA: DUF4232 domain-containing protein [Aeromicrobium sp.]|nr:DUF4232 domain-containing protein [Aeromicrobium sp.]
MKALGVALATLLIVGCSPVDPMKGRAGSDLPPGPLQPLPSDTSTPAASCGTLEITVGESEHSAGTEYVRLHFTNRSAKPCSVRGYPALTLRDSSNRQVGETARTFVSGGAKDLVLEPKETVTADVAFPNPDNFERGVCKTGTVKLEVLIPGATERASVADNHPYCPGWTVSALHR